MEGKVRFAVDGMLGHLAKYLRVLGYDTIFDPALGERMFRIGESEGRIIVTLRKTPPGFFHGNVLVIEENSVEKQLRGIFKRIKTRPSRSSVLTLCLKCNARTVEVAREEVFDRVPPAVRERVASYRLCRECGRVFWWGSHAERMMELLNKSGVFDR